MLTDKNQKMFMKKLEKVSKAKGRKKFVSSSEDDDDFGSSDEGEEEQTESLAI